MINKLQGNKLGALTTSKVTPVKVNEIIDALNDSGLNYKVYVALLTQSGTNAPVATILQNTIGNIVWSRTSAGSYGATLTGAFTSGKTMVIPPANSSSYGAIGSANLYGGGSDNANSIYLLTGTIASDGTTAQADDILYGSGYSIIEIRVYN